MNKNKCLATFKKHYATFRVNQKTYYDNVKENFITQGNFVFVTLRIYLREIFILSYCKMIYDEKNLPDIMSEHR